MILDDHTRAKRCPEILTLEPSEGVWYGNLTLTACSNGLAAFDFKLDRLKLTGALSLCIIRLYISRMSTAMTDYKLDLAALVCTLGFG